MARIQTMIVPSAGRKVEFVIVIDDLGPNELQRLALQNDDLGKRVRKETGARGVIIYGAGRLDVE